MKEVITIVVSIGLIWLLAAVAADLALKFFFVIAALFIFALAVK